MGGRISFLPIQDGTGIPSPENVRSIRAPLHIDGIGEIYGGYVDIDTGTVVDGWTPPLQLGEPYYYASMVCMTAQNASGILPNESDPSKYDWVFDFTPTIKRSWDGFGFNARNAFANLSVSGANNLGYEPPFITVDGTKVVNPWWVEWYESLPEPPKVSCTRRTPIVHSLTPAQLKSALDQLHYVPEPIIEARHRILMNTPHLVTPASSGLVTFNADMVAPLKECRVHFSPVQEGAGDPSPDNVRPITGWTGVEVYRAGKNLFKNDVTYKDPSNIALSNTNNRVFTPYTYSYGASYSNWWQPNKVTSCTINTNEVRVTTVSSDYGVGIAIPIKGGNTICSSYVNVNNLGRLYLAFYRKDGKYISGGQNNNGVSRLIPDEAVIGVVIFSSDDKADAIFTDISITYGSNASEFEPYSGTTIPIDWSDSGTIYGGYVDLVKGEVVKEAIKVTPNDIVSFHDITDRGNGVYEICLNLPIYARSDRRTEAKCSCFLYGSTSTGIADRFDLTYVLNQKARQIRVSHHFEEVPTIDAYREYLQSIGFEVVYYVDQERYTIDPITLKTLRGLNNVWSNANGNIDLSYFTHK